MYDHKSGANMKVNPIDYTSEHDRIKSRLTGREHEIMFMPMGGSKVPKNPFVSAAQRGFMHAHPEVLGKEALKEWDRASKGKKLPEHASRKK